MSACSEGDAPALYRAADAVRAERVGNAVHLRALIEFSNYCCCNCLYCGLRRDNRALTRYRLSPEEIVETARRAEELGYRTVGLQSGEDPWFREEILADIVRQIHASTDLAITLSVGERPKETYRVWRDAGDNVMMPNVTPARVRPDYEIYANKICVNEDADQCVRRRIEALGRTIATDRGHVKRMVNEE